MTGADIRIFWSLIQEWTAAKAGDEKREKAKKVEWFIAHLERQNYLAGGN